MTHRAEGGVTRDIAKGDGASTIHYELSTRNITFTALIKEQFE